MVEGRIERGVEHVAGEGLDVGVGAGEQRVASGHRVIGAAEVARAVSAWQGVDAGRSGSVVVTASHPTSALGVSGAPSHGGRRG